MQKIRMNRCAIRDQHWLRYRNDDGIYKNILLSACHNNFSLVTKYKSNDSLKCIGWHYVEDEAYCYELFCTGHVVFFAPIKPTIVQKVLYLFQAKHWKSAHNDYWERFELQLNQCGWKTISR